MAKYEGPTIPLTCACGAEWDHPVRRKVPEGAVRAESSACVTCRKPGDEAPTVIYLDEDDTILQKKEDPQ